MAPWSGSVDWRGCTAVLGSGRGATYGGCGYGGRWIGLAVSGSLASLSTECPQPVHHGHTAWTGCPHDVEALPAIARLRCRAMSHTPTYDQLRGERINADVPVSQAHPGPVDQPGSHHLRADTPTAATGCSPSPGPRGDRARDRSGFGTGNVDRPGKHRLRNDAPAATVGGGPSPGPGVDLAEDWSWFGTGEPGRPGPTNAPPSAHSLAGTPGRGHMPVAGRQVGADPRGASEQAARALVPAPTHAHDRQQPGALGIGRDAEAGSATR